MPEITPEQREAAWQAIRKWTAAIGSGPQDPDYAIDALIAEGWGPVADAEARGYRAGVEDAAASLEGRAANASPIMADLYREMVENLRLSLADKPKETPHGR